MVQILAVTMVASVPETVHTEGVELAKVTSEPDVSDATPNEKVVAPPETHVWGPGAVQVMVWGIGVIVTVTICEVNDSPVTSTTAVPMFSPVMTSLATPPDAATPVRPVTDPAPDTWAKVSV